MTDPTIKFIALASVPLIIAILIVYLAYLAIKFKLKTLIDSINFFFWGLTDCYVYGVSRGKVLGTRLFIQQNSIDFVCEHLLYGAANALGLVIAIWWRIIFFQITASSTCIDGFDCYSTPKGALDGFPKYIPCVNSSILPADTVLICLSFSVPTLDLFFTRIGVAYGFTMIIFHVIRLIMKFNGGPQVNNTISFFGSLFFAAITVITLLGAIILSTFTEWLTKTIINYIIPFMILLSIIIAFLLFGCMNRKLRKLNDPFDDGDLVYYIRKQD